MEKSVFFMFRRTFYKSDPTCTQKNQILTSITSSGLSPGWVGSLQPSEEEGVHLQHPGAHRRSSPHHLSFSPHPHLWHNEAGLLLYWIINRLFQR